MKELSQTFDFHNALPDLNKLQLQQQKPHQQIS